MVLALPANPHYLPVFRAVPYPRPVILVLTEEPVLVIPELESTHAQARSHVRDIRTYSDLGLGGRRRGARAAPQGLRAARARHGRRSRRQQRRRRGDRHHGRGERGNAARGGEALLGGRGLREFPSRLRGEDRAAALYPP